MTVEILSMPVAGYTAFSGTRFCLKANTQVFTSPLTGSVQTLELPGSRWVATYTLPPMLRADAEQWMAFLTRLNGRAGRFYAGDPPGAIPRGVAGGTPVVSGASQTGRTLYTDGWLGGPTGTGYGEGGYGEGGYGGPAVIILKAGDYVAWDTPSGWRELKKVTADVLLVPPPIAIPIMPPIRESPADGAALILLNATCVMALAEDAEAEWEVDAAMHYHLKPFNAEEVFG